MFSGRVAVVTGGGSGIGRAVCGILAKENASIVIADKNFEGANETIKLIGDESKHLPFQCDVSKSDSVNQMFASLKQKYNKPATLLVNCAGIFDPFGTFLVDMSEDDFDKVIDVNLKGTFLTTKTACKMMIDDKVSDGSIVNVSSISAKIGNIGQSNYAASKAGVSGFTRTVAREMAKYNIRCNAVMPGYIDTPLIADVTEKVMNILLKTVSLRRKGRPEEVAEAIAFLLSPKSSYITGTILPVSSGID